MLNWEVMNQIIVEGQENGTFKKSIDTVLTLASTFGTISQFVNTPCIAAHAMGEKDETNMFSDAHRLRVKTHLKQMMKAHLMILDV